MEHDPRRRAEWALMAILATATASGSSWLVKLSPTACIAEWNIHEILDDDATVSAVRLVSDSASHTARYDNPDLDPRAPVVEWCLGGSGAFPEVTGIGLPLDTSSVPVEVRLFPDHDEEPSGFFPRGSPPDGRRCPAYRSRQSQHRLFPMERLQPAPKTEAVGTCQA